MSYSLKAELEQSAVLETETKYTFPIEQFCFREEVIRLLLERHLIEKPVALEDLHHYIDNKLQTSDDYGINQLASGFYETSPLFTHYYHGLIGYIYKHIISQNFLFQKIPTIRFHFPVDCPELLKTEDGLYLNYHSDTFLGHPFAEINCWLPLTSCYGSNALQLSSLLAGKQFLTAFCEDIGYSEDIYDTSSQILFFQKLRDQLDFRQQVMAACPPVVMNYGELLLFDSRCIHATAENKEKHTRISLDFRLIPLDKYQTLTRVHKGTGRTKRSFVRGDIYHDLSADELSQESAFLR